MADFEHEQAGAELDQAQVKLEVIVIVGAKFVVEVEVEDWVQILAPWVGGGWMGGLKQN